MHFAILLLCNNNKYIIMITDEARVKNLIIIKVLIILCSYMISIRRKNVLYNYYNHTYYYNK